MISLLIPSLLLSLIGLFNIFGLDRSLFLNQFFFITIAFLAFFLIKKIGRNFFSSNSKILYLLFLFSLIITFIIGFEAKGSKRWINLYFFNFQASEILKPFFILYLSEFLIFESGQVNSLKKFIKSLILFAIPTLIIFKQPDLGNASVYTFVFFMMLLFSDLPKKYVLYIFLFAILSWPFGWFLLKDYQKSRILSFFNPHLDTLGVAYNMTQAIITVGSGKFLGRGLGFGTQSRLNFLPENHTDFAFASLVEQFGFLLGFVVIILYFIIVVKLLKKIVRYFSRRDENDKKKYLYMIGFLSFLIFQIAVNIGMNLGLFPITGINLPFISYGGSSLVAIMIGLALLAF